MTAVNDIDGDGFEDLAYLKGGPFGVTDYRLVFVSGPPDTSPGGTVLDIAQEAAPDDYWLDFWTPLKRTVQIARMRLRQ